MFVWHVWHLLFNDVSFFPPQPALDRTRWKLATWVNLACVVVCVSINVQIHTSKYLQMAFPFRSSLLPMRLIFESDTAIVKPYCMGTYCYPFQIVLLPAPLKGVQGPRGVSCLLHPFVHLAYASWLLTKCVCVRVRACETLSGDMEQHHWGAVVAFVSTCTKHDTAQLKHIHSPAKVTIPLGSFSIMHLKLKLISLSLYDNMAI